MSSFAYRLKKYGLTVKDYTKMFRQQGKGCAICGKPPKKRRLAVDHSHKTGKVRGLLCYHCNRGLGWFYDNEEYLTKAAAYIFRSNRKELV